MPHDLMPLFRVGQSISGFPVVGGNRGKLLGDSDDVIDHMVADIDAAERARARLLLHLARRHQRPEGGRGAEARRRPRRHLPRHGRRPRQPGDGPLRALEGHGRGRGPGSPWRCRSAIPLSRPLKGRIDMRNHRKIVVIDNRITYCGSNNCADAAFAIKPRFAPWVDAMMRFEGPIVRQNQHVFASDWMGHVERGSVAALRGAAGDRRGLPGAGDRDRRHRALFGDARDVREPDVRGPPRARHHHPLLRARRADPGRALRQRPPRRRHDRRLPGPERQLDRGRRQPQLLSAAPRRRGEDLRVRRRPAAHQVDDRRRRDHADRLGQHRPPQLRAQLREQHPASSTARSPPPCARGRRATSPARSGSTPPTSCAGRGGRHIWNNTIAMLGPVL